MTLRTASKLPNLNSLTQVIKPSLLTVSRISQHTKLWMSVSSHCKSKPPSNLHHPSAPTNQAPGDAGKCNLMRASIVYNNKILFDIEYARPSELYSTRSW